MSNACACANTAERERGVSGGQHMYMRVTDRFGHRPDSTVAREDLRLAAAESKSRLSWAESILSLWYENQIALLYAKWIDDQRSVRWKGVRRSEESTWIGIELDCLPRSWSSCSSICEICVYIYDLWIAFYDDVVCGTITLLRAELKVWICHFIW